MNSRNIIWLTTLLLPVTIVNGESSEAIYPSNTAIVSGNNFSFPCGTPFHKITIQWKFRRGSTYGELSLYNGTHVSEAFQDFVVHTIANGPSILTKSISKADDAGTYICIEKNEILTNISSAQLIVLANEPVCKANKKDIKASEFLKMECIVNYTGSISPMIKWSRSDGINPIFHNNITNVNSSSSVVSILATQTTGKDNGVTFKSTVYFPYQQDSSASDKTVVQKATNTPKYEFQWTHQINVLFAPKDVQIAPKKEIYSIGDILYCVADGNPTPSYEWTELDSGRVVSRQSSLTIDNTEKENRTYKCTATNYLSSKETAVNIHAVTRPPTNGVDYIRSVTIAAGVTCVTLFIVIVTFVIRRFKGRFWQNNRMPTNKSAQPEKRERGHNPLDSSVTVVQSHSYESVEMLGVEEDRIVQPQTTAKSWERDNVVQPSSEEQLASNERRNIHSKVRTIYTMLGDRPRNPSPPVYESLEGNVPFIQDPSSQVGINFTSEVPVVSNGEGFEEVTPGELYANGTYVNVNLGICK